MSTSTCTLPGLCPPDNPNLPTPWSTSITSTPTTPSTPPDGQTLTTTSSSSIVAPPPTDTLSTGSLSTTSSLIVNSSNTTRASSPSSSTISSAAKTSCSGTYSTGTAAGIGVGSAFAGALFAVCVGFIWLFEGRLRNVKHRKSRSIFSHAARPTATTLPAALDRLDDALPQALTHVELAKEASQLETAIRNYLDNYIDWDGAPKSPPLDDGRLSEQAGGLRVDWRQKLHSKGSRSVTLRMFVARFITTRISVTSSPDSTLLPPDVIGTYQTILAGQKRMLMGPASQHAFPHTWRAMTAFLISGDYPQDRASTSANNPLYEAINRSATHLRETLTPLRCRRRGTEDRETDVLRELLAKAALLGLHIFSQRNVTEFFWSQKFEVFPGLRQKPLLPGAMDGASWVIVREPQL